MREIPPDNESVFRALFEKSPEGLVLCDPSLRIMMVNDQFCLMFGYEREEVVGRNLNEVVAQGALMRDEADRLSKEYLHSGILQTETVRQKKDGSSFPVSIFATPLMIDNAQIGSLSIYRDITEHREREDKIRTSEAKLRDILESHPELILRFTPDLVTTYANKAYCDYHGISPDEVTGKPFEHHIAPEYVPLVYSKLTSLTPENPISTDEEQVIMDSGEVRWQEWTDHGIFDEEGRLVEIQSVGRDITDRKRMEEALAFEKEALGLLFENADEGIVLCEKDGTIVQPNPMFCRMFGYSRDEAVGRNIDDLVASDPSVFKEARNLTLSTANGKSAASEAFRRRKDGSPIEVSFLGVPIMTRGGKGFAFGIYRDISERRRSEEALRKSEEKFRDLFNTMPNGFYTSTPEGYFIEANPAFVSMLGYDSLEELRSVYIPDGIYVHESERLQAAPETPNRKFDEHIETYRLKRKDGQVIWVEDHARYIKDSNGKVIFNQGICQDITDRKRAEEELHRLNRELFISATTDKVTGLLNRQHFEDAMQREISRSSRYGTPLSLIMMDLDNFKKLNDTRGHIAGDRALAEIAGIIRDHTRASDLAARWGGDEFVLAAPTTTEHTAALAEKIRSLLMTLQHNGFGPVSGSFGVSAFHGGDNIESFTNRSDELMYQAKRLGGNNVQAD